MKHDVITFGSATLDIFAESSQERSMTIRHGDEEEDVMVYPSGEKVLLSELHTDIGGGGTNTAAALTRLGLSVAFGGALGSDKIGDDIVSWLSENGIDFVGPRVEGQTNLSVVLDSKKLHDRTILVYKESSDKLRSSDLDFSSLDATWFYFSSLLGESYRTMIDLMRHARSNGIAVAFNPSNYQAQQGLDRLREPLELSNLLVLNKEEAELLVGLGDAATLCKRLRDAGGEIVLVTDAGNGATLLYADTLYYAKPSGDSEVVETTGAGDCFAASFVAGLTINDDPEQALRLALINTESLISKVGAKQGLLDREEALSRLASDDRSVSRTPL